MNPNGLLNQSRQSFSKFWALRNARERMMLGMAAMIAGSGFAYAILINPALTGQDRLKKNLPELRQQVAQMRAYSNEVSALSKSSSAMAGKSAAPLMMSKQNIEAALARNRLKPQSVVLAGDSAKVQLTSVSFAGTLSWLEDIQKTTQVSVSDANIITLARPDMVNATFTLRQQRNE